MFLDANILTEPDPKNDRGTSTTNKDHRTAIEQIRALADKEGWQVSEISSGGATSDFMLGNLNNVSKFKPEENGLQVVDSHGLYSTMKNGFAALKVENAKGSSPNEVMISTLERAAKNDGPGFSKGFTENNLHKYPCHKTFEAWMSNTIDHMKASSSDKSVHANADRLSTALQMASDIEAYKPVEAGRSRSPGEYRIESFNSYQIAQKLVHEQSGVSVYNELDKNGLLELFHEQFPSVTQDLIQEAKAEFDQQKELQQDIRSGLEK